MTKIDVNQIDVNHTIFMVIGSTGSLWVEKVLRIGSVRTETAGIGSAGMGSVGIGSAGIGSADGVIGPSGRNHVVIQHFADQTRNRVVV